MRVLALDLSCSTGWAVFDAGELEGHGRLEQVFVTDFNVNAHPNESSLYPQNVMEAARQVARLVAPVLDNNLASHIVIENTVKGRNRHTQRILEWIHFTVLQEIIARQLSFSYMDPSQWRKVLDLRLSNADKKNNKEVRAGKKRGLVGKKHVALAFVNQRFKLSLRVKDDDIADAVCIALAYVQSSLT